MEISKAIRLVRDLMEKCHPVGLVSREALQTLLNLATDLEKISQSGLVVEEEKRYTERLSKKDRIFQLGYNASRQQQILLLKKNLTVEKLIKIINNTLNKYEVYFDIKKKITMPFYKILAQEVINNLLEGK